MYSNGISRAKFYYRLSISHQKKCKNKPFPRQTTPSPCQNHAKMVSRVKPRQNPDISLYFYNFLIFILFQIFSQINFPWTFPNLAWFGGADHFGVVLARAWRGLAWFRLFLCMYFFIFIFFFMKF